MNLVVLLGRLTRDPELRYSQSENPTAVCRYTLAVNRSFKREGQPDADFINCVSFGKTAEFANQYFVKGQQIAIEGRIQVSSWEDQQGQRRWNTDVIVDRQYFAEGRRDRQGGGDYFPGTESQVSTNPGYSPQNERNSSPPPQAPSGSDDDFFVVGDGLDDENLPF